MSRPLVTFAIFAYNHERFIAEAIRGALAQTYAQMEILISDDASRDRTVARIEETVAGAAGPHEVRVNRNERNLGFGAHINRVMELAKGQLIVAAGGDDVSLPGRVERLVEAYDAGSGRVMSVYSNAIEIDAAGERRGLFLPPGGPPLLTLEAMAGRLGGALGCAHAWDRRVFDVFGPIDDDTVFEDNVIPFRSALLGDVRFVDEPLVLYRRHGANLHFKDAWELKDGREVGVHLLRHADAKIGIFAHRLRDLETLSRRFPDRAGELRAVRTTTVRMLREMRDERTLLTERHLVRRLRVMMAAAAGGTPPRRIVRWILTFLFPGVYLRYLRRVKPSATPR